MMTREEASRHLHNDWYIENGHLCVYENARDLFLEAVGIGIKALRPVNREQVEKIWKSKWVPLNNTQEHFCNSCGVAFNLYSYCKNDYRFCPYCGAPMTDEAVQMVLERIEALV